MLKNEISCSIISNTSDKSTRLVTFPNRNLVQNTLPIRRYSFYPSCNFSIGSYNGIFVYISRNPIPAFSQINPV